MFIIVEGIDNVGKSTLIQNLKDRFNVITFHALHYSNVKQKNEEESIAYSKKMYTEMFELMDFIDSKHNSSIICDRSHIGEAVYSPMYRHYSGDYVFEIEKCFINNNFWQNLYLITLIDLASAAISRDDGLSFSTDLKQKETEIELFKRAHNLSLIKNKKIIDINGKTIEEVLEEANIMLCL